MNACVALTCAAGEGFHNVAQREWRANPEWDGKSEPYTLDNDAEYRYIDAELNDKGRGQAIDLQQQTALLQPQLLVVSPMRRATQTGLLAFAPHIERKELPVLAHELCHERAGKHTCDNRLGKTRLAELYPTVACAAHARSGACPWHAALASARHTDARRCARAQTPS